MNSLYNQLYDLYGDSFTHQISSIYSMDKYSRHFLDINKINFVIQSERDFSNKSTCMRILENCSSNENDKNELLDYFEDYKKVNKTGIEIKYGKKLAKRGSRSGQSTIQNQIQYIKILVGNKKLSRKNPNCEQNESLLHFLTLFL